MPSRGARRTLCLLLLAISGAVATLAASRTVPGQDTGVTHPSGDELEQARARWRRLATVATQSSLDTAQIPAVVDRLIATAHGRTLLRDLSALLLDRPDGLQGPVISIVFADRLPRCNDDSNGCFQPDQPGAATYQVYVRAEHAAAAREPTVFVFGEYPGTGRCDIVTFYQEAVSTMAETLYHELLHVWFLNAYAGQHRRYPTGHGLVARCEFEDEFLDALQAEAFELATVEGRAPRPALQPRTGKP